MLKKYVYSLFAFLVVIPNLFGQTNTKIQNSATSTLLGDNVYFCAGEKFNLKVNAAATATGDYTATKDYPASYPLTAGNTPIQFTTTGANPNKFSKPIPIGFDFSFYGQTYTQVVAGTNGRLLFSNSTELSSFYDNTIYKDRTFSGLPTSAGYTKAPSADYNKIYLNSASQQIPLAQVFFGYTDLYWNSNSSTTYNYKQINFQSLKGLLISYQNEVHTDGLGGTSGNTFESYVILLEDGRIVVYVNNKNDLSYNAILGIQNESSDKSKFPDPSNRAYDYNNGKWVSEGVAWVFTPSQNLQPHVDWKVAGTVANANPYPAENTTFTDYAPQDASATGEKLEATISFYDPSTNRQVGSPTTSSVIFKKVKVPVISKALDGCNVVFKISDDTYDANLKYHWYKNGADTGKTERSINMSRSTETAGDFYVVAAKPDGTICSNDAAKSNILNFGNEKFPATTATAAGFCDNTGTGTKTVNLYDLFYPKYNPTTTIAPYVVTFFDNGVMVSDPENYRIAPNKKIALTFSVAPSTGAPSCITGPLGLDFLSGVPTMQIDVCAGDSTYNLSQVFTTKYPGFAISYTYKDNGLPITDPTAVEVGRAAIVKVSGVACAITTEVNFIKSSTITVPLVPVQERCKGADNNDNRFNFNSLIQNLDPTGQYLVKFYRKSDNSEITVSSYSDGSDLNAAGYFWTNKSGDYIVYAKLFNKSNPACFGASGDIILRVYATPQLKNTSVTIKNCYGNPIFDLTQKTSDLTETSGPAAISLEYYDENNNLLTGTQVTAYNENTGLHPKIKVIYNISCANWVTLDLQHQPKIALANDKIPVCDQKIYPAVDFEKQIVANPSNYSFTDENGNALPANFDVSALPAVKVVLTDKITFCKSDVFTVTFIPGTPTAVVGAKATLEKCDDDFDGITNFNLEDAKNQISSDTNAVFEYFKDIARTQKISSSYTNEAASLQTIYGRVTSRGFCPTNFELVLKVNTPAKLLLKDKYEICYGETLPIDAGNDNVKWEWSDGQTSQIATFTKAGSYSVKLTNATGCPYIHNFVISDENQPVIKQINQTSERIEVIATGGIAPYQYSFDNGASWTASNVLVNPTENTYTILVKSSNNCVGAPKHIYNIVIYNVITPNGDGKNDIWTVKNLGYMQNIEVKISDRYGKILYSYTQNSPGVAAEPSTNASVGSSRDPLWDGMYNGRVLPTASYWYGIKWHDPSTNKDEVRQGWIFLKNRE